MSWRKRDEERDRFRGFELHWSRTSPQRANDFSANEGPTRVGRVHVLGGGHWQWAMMATVGGHTGTASGSADDRDAACLQVERHYRLFRQKIGAREK